MVDNCETAIAVLGGRCWPQKAKQGGDKISKHFVICVADLERWWWW